MNTWTKFDAVIACLGVDETLLSIAKAIGDCELNETLDYIIRVWDLEEEINDLNAYTQA